MTIYKTARFSAKPAALEKCQQAIIEFVAYIKANEPDTLRYISLQDTQDPTAFLHYFIFKDAEAEDRHSNSEGVKRFTAVLYPELTSNGVDFTDYTQLATTT
jgi:quinol monooxygenase YgiN